MTDLPPDLVIPGSLPRQVRKANLKKIKLDQMLSQPNISIETLGDGSKKITNLDTHEVFTYEPDKVQVWNEKTENYDWVVMPEETSSLDEANIVISLLPDGTHAPVLDLDIPHVYVPSSTPGHGHLYLDVPMDDESFWIFLELLSDLGIIEEGYFQASKARGYSAVRLPWIKKEFENSADQTDPVESESEVTVVGSTLLKPITFDLIPQELS